MNISEVNKKDRMRIAKVHDDEYNRLVKNGENVCYAAFMADIASLREVNKILDEYKEKVNNGNL